MPDNVRDRDELLLNAIVTGDTSGIDPRDREERFIKAIAEKKTDVSCLITTSDYPRIFIYTEAYQPTADLVTGIEYDDGTGAITWGYDDIIANWDTLKKLNFVSGFGTNQGNLSGIPFIVGDYIDIIRWYVVDTSTAEIHCIIIAKGTSGITYYTL